MCLAQHAKEAATDCSGRSPVGSVRRGRRSTVGAVVVLVIHVWRWSVISRTCAPVGGLTWCAGVAGAGHTIRNHQGQGDANQHEPCDHETDCLDAFAHSPPVSDVTESRPPRSNIHTVSGTVESVGLMAAPRGWPA